MDNFSDLQALGNALGRAFPELSTLIPLRRLGAGFGSLAVETPGGIVFRIARTAEAGEQYAREASLLVALPVLPVAVPRPEWFLSSSADFPFGLMGYRKLPGQPLEPQHLSPAERESLADQMGEVILALQRVSTDRLPAQHDPVGRVKDWQKLHAAVLPALHEAFRPHEYQKLAGWWDSFLNDSKMRDYPPVFQHGDLWYGNLLVDAKRITGLIDFQEAGTGDPAQDFVPQLYLGERFMRRVMAAFIKSGGIFDSGFEHRLTALWALREFGGLAYSIQHNDRDEWLDSIEKIRKGPILSRSGLDGWG